MNSASPSAGPPAVHWRFPGCPEPPNWGFDWEAIRSAVPGVADLDQCPQDPIHHAEGNVGIHTRMVCDALIHLGSWRASPPLERSIVFAGAVLHDIAKPLRTRSAEGRVSSPGHARRGSRLARLALWRHDGRGPMPESPFAIREAVADLVLLHGLPLNWPNQPDLLRRLYEASWRVRLDHLAMLAEADVLGRRCADQRGLLERVALFRELADEQGCLDRPRSFASDHTRFLYFQGRELHPDSPAYESFRNDVILMSGLPGAGKDSWIAREAADRPVISLDRIRRELGVAPEENQGAVIERAKSAAFANLRQGRPFVWNATNLSGPLRDALIRRFAAYDALVTIVYLDVPWPELLRRNRMREYAVPERVLEAMSRKLEPPSRIEAHQVRIASNGDGGL